MRTDPIRNEHTMNSHRTISVSIRHKIHTDGKGEGSNKDNAHYSPTGIYSTIIAPQGYIGN